MDSETLAIVLGSGGGVTLLTLLVNGFLKWRSGEAGRERTRNTDLLSQRNRAIEERIEANKRLNRADDMRRLAMEYAYSCRWVMTQHGVDPPPMPPALLEPYQP